MNSHCRVEEEILRSSHGPGVVPLQRKPPALPQGGRRDWPGGASGGSPRAGSMCISQHKAIRKLLSSTLLAVTDS